MNAVSVSTAKQDGASPSVDRASDGAASREAAKKKAKKLRRMPARQLERIRAILREKEREISAHVQTELSELESPERMRSGDLEEMVGDSDGTDSLCEIMDIEATQIGQIKMALKKIEDGTYGICEDCEEEIAPARLEALPFASQCIDCKRRSELMPTDYPQYSSYMS